MDTGKASWQPGNDFTAGQWRLVTANCNANAELAEAYLHELITAYSGPGRHYHTLAHIEHLLRLSNEHAAVLQSKLVVDLAVFYHDIVYQVPATDNEHQSAVLAAKRLRSLGMPEAITREVCVFIEATKTHEPVETEHLEDLCYFLDFDMCILAADWEIYLSYIHNVREEYRFYPDELYRPGRAGFLRQTLAKAHFFYTPAFRKLEQQARQNMERELSLYI
jgi:predicted metal-dependent HD superfamily phosphohydrolase